jgi:hypothetical protein
MRLRIRVSEWVIQFALMVSEIDVSATSGDEVPQASGCQC